MKYGADETARTARPSAGPGEWCFRDPVLSLWFVLETSYIKARAAVSVASGFDPDDLTMVRSPYSLPDRCVP